MADILFSQIANENLRTGTDIIHTTGRDVLGLGASRYISDNLATQALMTAHPRFVARSSNGRFWRALPENGRIGVEVGGARGDAATDDGPAIRATFAYAAAIGARSAAFGTMQYRFERIHPVEAAVDGNPPLQILPTGPFVFDYGGAAFTRQSVGRGLSFNPANIGPVIDLPLAEDVASGSRSVVLTPAAAAQVAAGDSVLWLLGEAPYDLPESFNWSLAVVEAVAGTTVTLDRPIPEGLVLSSVTGLNKRLRKMAVMRDAVIRDATLAGPSFEDGVSVSCGERVTIERIGGKAMGAGIVSAQFCDGLTITDCWQEGSWLAQASFGPAFNFAECRNVMMTRPRAKGTKAFIHCEAGAHVSVIGGHFENTMLDAQGQPLGYDVVVLDALGRSTITAHDLTVSGYGGYRLIEESNGQQGYDGAVVLSGTVRLRHPTPPFSIPLNSITGKLDMTIDGVREVYDFSRLRYWKKRFVLRDGEYRYAFGPAGLLARARAYVSPGIAIGSAGQLTGFWMGRRGDNGTNYAGEPTTKLQAGVDVNLPSYGGIVGGRSWTLRNEPLSLLCVTAADAGLNAVMGTMAMDDLPRDPFEALFPAYDLPPLEAGERIAFTVPIAAMTAADFIDSVRFSGGFAGLELRGAEALDGAARLTIVNPGPDPIDRAAADLGIAFTRSVIGN